MENVNKRSSVNSKGVKKASNNINSINQYYQPAQNTITNNIQPITYQQKENKENNNLESNILGLLNKHRTQNNMKRSGNNQVVIANSKENLEKLNEKHEKLINTILTEEEKYISNHKIHIDEMVEIIKSVYINL